MGIKTSIRAIKLVLYTFIILTTTTFVGCSQMLPSQSDSVSTEGNYPLNCFEYYKYVDFYENIAPNYTTEADKAEDVLVSEYPYEESYAADNMLFGRWLLEKHVLSRDPEYIPGPSYTDIGLIVPDISDFIGTEMIFDFEFVSLAGRIFYGPEYNIWSFRRNFEDYFFFSTITNGWLPGHYSNPKELINSFEQQGISIGERDETSEFPKFEMISISYPLYRGYMWRSAKLDPELLEPLKPATVFNPLLQRFIVLNEDYILVGGSELILARRIY